MEALAKQAHLDIEDDSVDIAKHTENCMQMFTVLKGLDAGLAKIPTSSHLYPLKDLFTFFEQAGVSDIL